MKIHYVTIIGHKILNKVLIRGLGLRIISGFQDLWNSLHLILWHCLFVCLFIYPYEFPELEHFGMQVSKGGMFLCGTFH